MQKFVVTKSAKQFPNSTSQSQSDVCKIRMSGYLKKKRKKMGGWRKLWFVLQNRLLLSYTSKEDYERKLAPFKDVVSLVPGTLIKPGKGFRFIIETTTNIVYTYRCDDYKTCSEWMGALVESLACDSRSSVVFQVQQDKYPYNNRSLDNLSLSQSKRSIKSSQSWESICRSRNVKSPANLPIAFNTARILERNGHDPIEEVTNATNGATANAIITAQNERVQNFRLHQNDQNVNQSNEVCRINSMFKRTSNSESTVCAVKQSNYCNSGNSSNSNSSSSSQNNNNNKNNMRGNSNSSSNSSNSSDQANMDQSTIIIKAPTLVARISAAPSAKTPTTTVDIDLNQYTKMKENCGNCFIEDKIRRLSMIELSTESNDVTAETKDIDLVEKRSNEPIYAVVDLKTKYARRAKLKDIQDKLDKERPRSCNVIYSDYEEVMHYPNFIELNEDENENIYEPVNIPELPPKSPMWKYFPKINLEALIELTRKRNRDEPSTFYDIRKRWGYHRKSIKNRMRKLVSRDSPHSISDDDLDSQGQASSQGSTSASSAKSASSSTSSSSTSANSIEKDTSKFIITAADGTADNREKIDRHIFGSLGRLRKSRTSLFLDEFTGRKKNGAGNDVTNFQKELKRELVKRNSSINEKKIAQCHSKFYD